MQACREIVALREEQLERCKSEITEAIVKGLGMLDRIRQTVRLCDTHVLGTV